MTNETSLSSGNTVITSRLIIKNLPKRITADRLKSLCDKLGLVTDCQLKYTASGQFRNFAFVGFRTVEEARTAKDYLHNTFIDSSKVQVEFCLKLSEATKRSKKFFQKTPTSSEKDSLTTATNNNVSSLKLNFENLPRGIKKKTLRNFLIPVKPLRITIDQPSDGGQEISSRAEVKVAKKSELNVLLKLDGRFFGGQKVKVSVAEKEENAAPNLLLSEMPQEAKDVKREAARIEDTGRLFVRNVAYVCSMTDLEEAFGAFGPLADVRMPVDPTTKQHKGYAMISFVLPENALKAFNDMDGTVFHGRMLHIVAGEECKEDKHQAQDEERISNGLSSFKAKKALKQAAGAGLGHNWNSLFLAPNAVADVVAEKLGADKSQLLDATAQSSLGVRMALAETQVVRDTRQYLTQNGVNLQSFESTKVKRSSCVILVKNLPANTDAVELKSLFSKHGQLGRFVMPPSGVSALIEFLHEQHAKAAFKALAYKKFKFAPLYLQWAPDDVFTVGIGAALPSCSNEHVAAEAAPSPTGVAGEAKTPVAESDDNDDGAVLFVKNLNFATTDQQLSEHFAPVGQLQYAQVARKHRRATSADDGSVGSTAALSMGYGFVAFKHRRDAMQALKVLQRKPLNDFALELKLSDRGAMTGETRQRRKRTGSEGEAGKSGKSDTKILVKNVPFQATDKEIESMFKTFGQLRNVRLPKKALTSGSSQQHRGFAFVDFSNASDARKAFEALGASTHLYGRRLVLQWAQQDESLDELRAKVAAGCVADKKAAKRQKVLLDSAD